MTTTTLGGVAGWGTYSTITNLYKRDKNDDDPDNGLVISSVQCRLRFFTLWQCVNKWEMNLDIHAPLVASGCISRRYETKAEMIHDANNVQKMFPSIWNTCY